MVQPAAATQSLTDAANLARQALSDSPVYLIRQIEVEAHGDALLLTGKVDSFYHKQLAQETVRAVAAGTLLSNVVAVDWPPQ